MPPAASPPPLSGSVTVHVVGDSTAAVFPPSDPTQRVGWAAALQPLFAKGVRVDDSARSGRSSKSFIDEGLWAALKANIRPGDYVLIQFGHNDEKIADRSRYTDPALSFREYLKVYIRDTRLAGGFAVLLTPISRREFAGNSIAATHGAYPAAILAVGRETGTPVIDMTDKTRALLEKLGPDETVPLFAVDDKTHLSARGAPEVASLVAEGLRELRLPLAARLAH
ncbi:MAG TPA: rhamnogalacturonan acetylesterase [Polyangiaceae bacterium]